MEVKIALRIASVVTLAVILMMITCHQQSPPSPNVDIQDLTVKSKSLDDEVKVLKEVQQIYVDRWKVKKVKGDSVFVYIYSSSPDTCKHFISLLNDQRLEQQASADSIVFQDSLIIANRDSALKVSDVIINKCKKDISTLTDSIKKVKRKNYWKGFKHGAIIGASSTQIINLITK
jgi:hypothetical protein